MNPGKKFLLIGRRKCRKEREDDRFYHREGDEFETYELASTAAGIEGTQMEGDGVEFQIVEVTE